MGRRTAGERVLRAVLPPGWAGSGLPGRSDPWDWRRVVPPVAFSALAGFAAAHWSGLVADPPVLRVLLVVAVTTAGGTAAAALRPAGGRGAAATRAALLLAAGVLAFGAMGLPLAMAWPAGWDELVAGIGRGLTGLRTLEWPYGGPDDWVRLTVLLVIPLTLSVAATLTFWPWRDGGRTQRAAGLVLLVALYGLAISQQQVGSPLVQGAMLLALLSAWLFLPRIRHGAASVAAASLLVALGVSLPLAGAIAPDEPVLDYRSWRWLGEPTRYDWNHDYGPIEWPRRGETLLTVQSRRPHYWKAAALDRFDGLGWVRSTTAASAGPDPAIPASAPARWRTETEVTVGALDSTLLVSPGSATGVEMDDTATVTRDGAARVEEEVEQGATYTVDAYAPNPSVERMRAAPDPPSYAVRSATLFYLPPAGRTNLDAPEGSDGSEIATGRPVALPRYSDGLGATPNAEQYVADSPYARVYRLARRLVRGAPTTYDAVQRVEAHLRGTYEYTETPPEREFPLVAFLFEDRAGYCQHFSGAMALMLRMNGIPARVATGFAPGERTNSGDAFTVRDMDAHSWVEVYFSGIGWVPFDPTPPGAPTASRADGTLASAARGNEGEPTLDLAEALDANAAAGAAGRPGLGATGGEGSGSGGSGGLSWLSVAVAGAVATFGGAALALVGRRRRRAWGDDAAVRELERALDRLGHGPAPGTTLMDLERHLGGTGRSAAARYVRRVREQRFAGGRRPADARARRALRRALTAGRGPLGRLRGYVVLPPRPGGAGRRAPAGFSPN